MDNMHINHITAAMLTGIALLSVGSAQLANAQGTWSFLLPADPIETWSNNGVVVKASNLGPAGIVQPVTVASINFDTNLSNVITGGDGNNWNSGYIPENPEVAEYYYTGPDFSVSNLVNTFAWVHEWWTGDPDEYLGINFTNLVAGHNYQFQLMVGFPWDGDGINVYGGDAANTYEYWASGDGQGTNVGIATFTWSATTNTGTFYVTEPYLYAEHELMAYTLIDTSMTIAAPIISSPKLLGGGQFQLTINSATNTILAILVSHDLNNWTKSQTVTNVSGIGTFTNNSATSNPTFYRLEAD
jgi:hypothetical protein